MPIPDLPDPPDPPDPPPPSTPRDDEGRSIPGDVPDLRRDALEEAAETSTEALDRTRRLDELPEVFRSMAVAKSAVKTRIRLS